MHPESMVRPWCVVCGRPAANRHHHPPKGIGGIGRKGTEPPVVSLCGSGNVSGCHGAVHRHDIELRNDKGRWSWRRRGGEWRDCICEMDW